MSNNFCKQTLSPIVSKSLWCLIHTTVELSFFCITSGEWVEFVLFVRSAWINIVFRNKPIYVPFIDFDLETLFTLLTNMRCMVMHTCCVSLFWVRQDECPKSYCRIPNFGICVHVNINLAYNTWTTMGRAFRFHMSIPCDKTFPWVPKVLT